MLKFTLTPSQKTALECRHRKSRDASECDRIKAVLLRSEGWALSSIAQALRMSEDTIKRHVSDYLEKEKLTPENGGSQSRLNDEQTESLIEHLSDHTYAHTYQIAAYIQDRWGINYTVSGLNKWLHQKGFTYKKPKGLPHKADAQKQEAFIQDYEALKASLPKDETILFMDAVHPTQATKITSGWIRKGQDKVINTTGSRTRLNIVGAIELGNLSGAVFDDYQTVNAQSIVAFFEKLRTAYPSMSTIHLVLDGAGYHRSSDVVAQAEKLNIKLHYLPAYSPNLNPIERLWKVMNEHARNNRYFAKPKEFRDSIQHFLEVTLPEIGASLTSRINDNFQRIKNAT